MKNKHSLSGSELNSLIYNAPSFEEHGICQAKDWQRVDVGDLEVYVGDEKYIIAFVEHPPKSIEEMEKNTLTVQEIVITYLQGEGFIGEDYVYVGLQQIDLTNLKKMLNSEEDYGTEE
jgi:hypothetical protein